MYMHASKSIQAHTLYYLGIYLLYYLTVLPSLSLCIRSDLPLVTSFYAFTYALTPLPYCNYVLCTMWFCLHVLQLLYVVPLVSGKDHVPLGYI